VSRPEREAIAAAALLGREIAFVALRGDQATGEAAGSFGAGRAIVYEGAAQELTASAAVGALVEVAGELEATAVLIPGDELGLEVAPRVAERLGGSAVTNAVDVESADGVQTWTRPVYGGKAMAKVRALATPTVVTVRPGAFTPAVAADGRADVELRPAASADDRVRLVSRASADQGAVDLEGARVVISGGRGIGGPDGFEGLAELARLLGGTVGASLAAVDEGWADHERQVGLTGRVVKPELYVAIGISGASQHLAGMGGAGTVVAINTDPDAPIFDAADLGVVMDHRELVPAVIEECRSRIG
jgi:electron transfer flavoprotein alpha subunit